MLLAPSSTAADMNGLGIYLMDHGKPGEAETAFREALSRRKELARRCPEEKEYAGQAMETRAALAVLWSGIGDHVRALAQVTGACYDLACATALASAAIAKDPKLAPGERSTAADRCATRAIELLSRAVRLGYANIKGIRTDADFNAIRDRAEFKDLLRELDAQAARSKTHSAAR
jgi:hypothetical protein